MGWTSITRLRFSFEILAHAHGSGRDIRPRVYPASGVVVRQLSTWKCQGGGRVLRGAGCAVEERDACRVHGGELRLGSYRRRRQPSLTVGLVSEQPMLR